MNARWLLLVACAACSPGASAHPSDMAYRAVLAPREMGARFRLLGGELTTVEAFRYDFAHEPSPTSADLHAVLVAGDRVYALGEGGAIVVRVGDKP